MAPKKEPFMKEDVPVASPVEELEETEDDTVDNVEATAPVEKPMYDAVCATCETPIQVPFVPDGSRPTFCKDCLRDYQRATAKARNEIEQKQVRETPRPAPAPSPSPARPAVKRPAYVPTEQPMSLAQTRHIEPKKFKALKKRQPDLGGIRALIDTAKRES
jgi:CxxC-x17-CxxC domain-containing protein